MARFYANENFALPVVAGLRQMGHDVLTSVEAGNPASVHRTSKCWHLLRRISEQS
jgi:isochorismate synthase EntC